MDLVKRRCELIKPGEDAFNTSLDEYERGMTAERLNEIFPVVKTCVVDLIQKVYAKESPVALKKGENVVSGGTFDVDTQAKLSKEIALKLGFDLEKGRLDVSVHPFTGGCGPGDVRMTTRYKENDLSEGLTGTIHETGHALYEQGKKRDGIRESTRIARALDGRPRIAIVVVGTHGRVIAVFFHVSFTGIEEVVPERI